METLPAFAALSENEKVIRTYRCTSLRQLLHKPAVGYLSITNKRLVYHSQNKSVGSESAILSEIPLEDVGSIAAYIGNSLNVITLIFWSIAFFVGTNILKTLFPGVLTGLGVSIILCLPYILGLLFEKNIISQDVSERILKNLEGTSVDSLIENANWSLLMNIFKYLFIVGMPIFAYNLAFETNFGRQLSILRYVLLLGAYILIYILISGRQRSFGLAVTSKTAGNSGIVITGVSFSSLLNGSNSAMKTLSAAPAEDAEKVARELGALVMDIQQMGDLGIEKWAQ